MGSFPDFIRAAAGRLNHIDKVQFRGINRIGLPSYSKGMTSDKKGYERKILSEEGIQYRLQ